MPFSTTRRTIFLVCETSYTIITSVVNKSVAGHQVLWRESPTANLQIVFWTGHIVHSKSCKTTAAASTNFFSIPSWLRLLSVWRNQVRLPTRPVLVSYVHFDQSLKYWLTSILTMHIIHIRTYLLFDWGWSFKPLFPTLHLWCERSRCVLNFKFCTPRDMPSAECHRSLKEVAIFRSLTVPTLI